MGDPISHSPNRISLGGEAPTAWEYRVGFPRRWETMDRSPTAMGDGRRSPTAMGSKRLPRRWETKSPTAMGNEKSSTARGDPISHSPIRIFLGGETPMAWECLDNFPRRWKILGLFPTAMRDYRHSPTAMGNTKSPKAMGNKESPTAMGDPFPTRRIVTDSGVCPLGLQ